MSQAMALPMEKEEPVVGKMKFLILFLCRTHYYSVSLMSGWHQMQLLLLVTRSEKTKVAGKGRCLVQGLPRKGMDKSRVHLRWVYLNFLMDRTATRNSMLTILSLQQQQLVLPLLRHSTALACVDSRTVVHTIPQYLSMPKVTQPEQLVGHVN
jgi:hypothetical protein